MLASQGAEPTPEDRIRVKQYPMTVIEMLAYADDDSLSRERMAAADYLRGKPEADRLLAKAMEHPGVRVAEEVYNAAFGRSAPPLAESVGDVRGEICRIVSEMLDNPGEDGIYQTTRCYDKLEALVRRHMQQGK